MVQALMHSQVDCFLACLNAISKPLWLAGYTLYAQLGDEDASGGSANTSIHGQLVLHVQHMGLSTRLSNGPPYIYQCAVCAYSLPFAMMPDV